MGDFKDGENMGEIKLTRNQGTRGYTRWSGLAVGRSRRVPHRCNGISYQWAEATIDE